MKKLFPSAIRFVIFFTFFLLGTMLDSVAFADSAPSIATDIDVSGSEVVRRGGVERVILDKERLDIGVGETHSLVASVEPSNVLDGTVSFSSSNPGVAEVDESGLVLGVSEGSAIIVASALGGGRAAYCYVSVGDSEEGEITLDRTNMALFVGDEKLLVAVVMPEEDAEAGVSWSSSDETVATVSEGLVKAVGEGVAFISAVSEANGREAVCSVVLTGKTPTPKPGSVVFRKRETRLNRGDSERITVESGGKIRMVGNPAEAGSLVWFSTDENVVEVNEGVVTAKSDGTALVVGKRDDEGTLDSCAVFVGDAEPEIESVSLDRETLSMSTGESVVLQVVSRSKHVSTKKKFVWRTSDASVASVDSTGKITAKSKGSATVSVRAVGGAEAFVRISVDGAPLPEIEPVPTPPVMEAPGKSSGGGCSTSGFAPGAALLMLPLFFMRGGRTKRMRRE